jgi:hypothetical protein
VRDASIWSAHSVNSGLLLGMAASIGCDVSVGPEYVPADATAAVSESRRAKNVGAQH